MTVGKLYDGYTRVNRQVYSGKTITTHLNEDGKRRDWTQGYGTVEKYHKSESSEYAWFKTNYPDYCYHRGNDEPAIIAPFVLSWHEDGELHRSDDLPAQIISKCPEFDPKQSYVGVTKCKQTAQLIWYKHGKVHREKGPAVIYFESEGTTKMWEQEGKIHRLDGPAVERANGTKEWYENGLLHRLDGPARIKSDGTQEWWVNGSLHREDGPARIKPDGTREWWVNSLRHREDGPAITTPEFDVYFLNNKQMTKEEWVETIRKSKLCKVTLAELYKLVGFEFTIVE